jgi:hypothetical protein
LRSQTAIGDAGHGGRELQGCDQGRALADAGDHGFAWLPRLAAPLLGVRLRQRAL